VKLEIKLDIKVPNDNTNKFHGSIQLKTDRRYTYIGVNGKTIIVDADEMYRAINALYGNTKQ